jgi:hypothetical protein
VDIFTIVVPLDQLPTKEAFSLIVSAISFRLGTSLMTTAFIIGRIVFIRRRYGKLTG